MRKKHIEITGWYKVQPTHIVKFWTVTQERRHKGFTTPREKRSINKIMSSHTMSQIRNSFNWLRIISNMKEVYSKNENKYFKFKLAFITLTLSDVQRHDDKYIKKHMLDPFLRWMQRSHNVNSYIWKAEVQSNGRIHFHITINKFIHWKSIRAKWNRLLAAHGYCKVFQDGTNDKGNSATQIKAVKNEKQITSYMCNYLAKSDWLKYEYDKSKLRHVRVLNEPIVYNDEFYSQQNFHTIHCTDGTYSTYKRFIEGRHWGASNNLNTTAALISEKGNIYQYMHHALSPEIFKFIQSKNCQVFIPHNKKFTRWLPDDLRDMISTKVKEMRKMDVIQTKVTVDSLFD